MRKKICIMIFLMYVLSCYIVIADKYEVQKNTIILDKHQYAMWTLQNVEGGYITLNYYDAIMDEIPGSEYIYVILFSNWNQYQKYLETGKIECYWAHGGFQYSGYDEPVYFPVTQPKTYYLLIDNTWGIIVTLQEAINDMEAEDDGSEFPDAPVMTRYEGSHDDQIVKYKFTFNLEGGNAKIFGPNTHNHQLSISLYQDSLNKDTDDSNQNEVKDVNTPGFEFIIMMLATVIFLYMKRKNK